MKTKTTVKKPAVGKTEKPVAAKPNGKTHATKPSKFSGKKLFPSPTVKKANPRREGTWGFKSREVIRQSPASLTRRSFAPADAIVI